MVNVLHLREQVGVPGQHGRVERAVVVLRRDLLRLRRPQEAQVGLGERAGAPPVDHLVHHRHDRFGHDGERGHDDLQPVRPIWRTARLASSSQAISTSPWLRWAKVMVLPRAPVSSTGTCLYSSGDIGLGLGLVAAVGLQRPAQGRQVVPARAARGLGVRRDDADAGLDQVGPVVDALRIALAHHEQDGRGVGHASGSAAGPASPARSARTARRSRRCRTAARASPRRPPARRSRRAPARRNRHGWRGWSRPGRSAAFQSAAKAGLMAAYSSRVGS